MVGFGGVRQQKPTIARAFERVSYPKDRTPEAAMAVGDNRPPEHLQLRVPDDQFVRFRTANQFTDEIRLCQLAPRPIEFDN